MSAGDAGGAAGDGAARGAGAELRALALLVLDRLEPVLARLREPGPDGPGGHGAGDPGPCPLCAVREALRGERPAAGLVERAVELAAAVREALADATPADAVPPPPAAGRRRVQRVPVDRTPRPTRGVQRVPVDRPPHGTSRPGGGDPAVGATPC